MIGPTGARNVGSAWPVYFKHKMIALWESTTLLLYFRNKGLSKKEKKKKKRKKKKLNIIPGLGDSGDFGFLLFQKTQEDPAIRHIELENVGIPESQIGQML